MDIRSFIELYISPRIGWEKLARKDFKIPDLYFRYIVFFALIPVIGHGLGFTIFRDFYLPQEVVEKALNSTPSSPFEQQKVRFLQALNEIIRNGIVTKEVAILMVYYIQELLRPIIHGIIIFFLSGSFGGIKDPDKAFTVATFSLVPFWISGLVFVVYNSYPNFVAFMMYISMFYVFYLVYIGSETVLKVPSENSKSFQFIIIFVILSMFLNNIFHLIIQTVIYKIATS